MLGIVILNYMTYNFTMNCIASIHNSNINIPYKIIVVENGSENDSWQKLTEKYNSSEHIHLLQMKKNEGFAKGNNAGINLCVEEGCDICLLTNSDIIFSPEAIQTLYEDILETDAVIVGPGVMNGKGNRQVSSKLYPPRFIDMLEFGRLFRQLRLDENEKDGIHEVYSVSGCCFMVQVEKFQAMGAFDPNTFLYNEENIMSWQAIQYGYKVCIDTSIDVTHAQEGSSGGVHSTFAATELIKSTLYYWKEYRGMGRIGLNLILKVYLMKIWLISKIEKKLEYKIVRKLGREYLKSILDLRKEML